jgi:hypothetical protein
MILWLLVLQRLIFGMFYKPNSTHIKLLLYLIFKFNFLFNHLFCFIYLQSFEYSNILLLLFLIISGKWLKRTIIDWHSFSWEWLLIFFNQIFLNIVFKDCQLVILKYVIWSERHIFTMCISWRTRLIRTV